MDLQHVVSDDEIRAELVDRAEELAAAAPGAGGALEGLDAVGQLTAESVAAGVGLMNEGAWGDPEHPAVLEAIVNRFARPVLLVQDSTFAPAVDGFPESQVVTGLLTSAKDLLDLAIARVGRVNLVNHRFDWVGTGWVVAPQIVVTNRHVAELFAAAKDADALRGREVGRSHTNPHSPVRSLLDVRDQGVCRVTHAPADPRRVAAPSMSSRRQVLLQRLACELGNRLTLALGSLRRLVALLGIEPERNPRRVLRLASQ